MKKNTKVKQLIIKVTAFIINYEVISLDLRRNVFKFIFLCFRNKKREDIVINFTDLYNIQHFVNGTKQTKTWIQAIYINYISLS